MFDQNKNSNLPPPPTVDPAANFDEILLNLVPLHEQLKSPNPDVQALGRIGLDGALGKITNADLNRLLGMAFESPVSGLPNRNVAIASMESALREVKAGGTPAAALFYDIVDFGNVNKELGHSVGDVFLGVFGAALDETGRKTENREGDRTFLVVEPKPKDPSDRGYHQGGDEFSRLMIGEQFTPELLTTIADRNARQILNNDAVRSLAASYPSVHTGIRVGITQLNAEQNSFADIQRDADPKTHGVAYYTINYSPVSNELTIYNQLTQDIVSIDKLPHLAKH